MTRALMVSARSKVGAAARHTSLGLALLLAGCLSDRNQGSVGVIDADTGADTTTAADTAAADTAAVADTTAVADTASVTDTAVAPSCPLPSVDLEVEWNPGPTGAISIDEQVLVHSHTPWFGGANFEWVTELLHDDGAVTRVRSRFSGRELPITTGERLRLVLRQDCPRWCNTEGALVDLLGQVRLFHFDASLDDSPYRACLHGLWCLNQAVEGHCPDDRGCSPRDFPAVRLTTPNSESLIVEARKGAAVAFGERLELLIHESYRVTLQQCDDAPDSWVRVAVLGAPTAEPCRADVLAFTKDNPEQYELYELCYPLAGADPTPELLAIDATLTCDSSGTFAHCAFGEASCVGALDYATPASKEIGAAKWAQLCALSRLGWITKIAGGHYLD